MRFNAVGQFSLGFFKVTSLREQINNDWSPKIGNSNPNLMMCTWFFNKCFKLMAQICNLMMIKFISVAPIGPPFDKSRLFPSPHQDLWAPQTDCADSQEKAAMTVIVLSSLPLALAELRRLLRHCATLHVHVVDVLRRRGGWGRHGRRRGSLLLLRALRRVTMVSGVHPFR